MLRFRCDEVLWVIHTKPLMLEPAGDLHFNAISKYYRILMEKIFDKINLFNTVAQSKSRILSLFLLIGKRSRGVKTNTYSSTQPIGVGAEATNLTPREQMLRSDWSSESYLTPPQTEKSNT